jgi:hypothetical protein
MNAACVSAISALAGSAVGGLTSGYTTWLTQRSQAPAGQVAARIWSEISSFVASKMYCDAMVNSEPNMPEIVDLYAMVSRMRVNAMPRSVMIVKTGKGVDPLKDFSEAAREELHAFSTLQGWPKRYTAATDAAGLRAPTSAT